jgi:hypothetical protein
VVVEQEHADLRGCRRGRREGRRVVHCGMPKEDRAARGRSGAACCTRPRADAGAGPPADPRLRR